MKRQKSPCQYCDRRYVGCHPKCYDYFMYRCYVEWEAEQIRKEKEALNDLHMYNECKHQRLKHWDLKGKRI